MGLPRPPPPPSFPASMMWGCSGFSGGFITFGGDHPLIRNRGLLIWGLAVVFWAISCDGRHVFVPKSRDSLLTSSWAVLGPVKNRLVHFWLRGFWGQLAAQRGRRDRPTTEQGGAKSSGGEPSSSFQKDPSLDAWNASHVSYQGSPGQACGQWPTSRRLGCLWGPFIHGFPNGASVLLKPPPRLGGEPEWGLPEKKLVGPIEPTGGVSKDFL